MVYREPRDFSKAGIDDGARLLFGRLDHVQPVPGVVVGLAVGEQGEAASLLDQQVDLLVREEVLVSDVDGRPCLG